jgi:VWFA-related protein
VFSLSEFAQNTRELSVGEGGSVEISNPYGRVNVRAEAVADGEKRYIGRLNTSSQNGVGEAAVKISGRTGHMVVTVEHGDIRNRVDLNLTLPERSRLKIETGAGAVQVVGNFALIDVTTDTGTVAVDVPDDELDYHFLWTESRPRYLSDFEIAEVKEKAAGRFEVRGRRGEGEKRRKEGGKEQAGTRAIASAPEPDDSTKGESEISDPKSEMNKEKGRRKKEKTGDSKAVELNFTTARGIILLNVAPSEVMSDLRERPLTNAAKAIVRSGDSMLMEAIRRASPKYFGDYARTLPPFERQPRFTSKSEQQDGFVSAVKTAVVRATDLNNRAIAGLEAKDFEVLENGDPREIISVEPSTAPFNLVLLLDVSGSVENYVNFIRKAARSFVDTVDKNDRVSIITFNEDVKVLSKFTTDKSALSSSLDTFDAGGGTAYYDALAYTIADTLRPLKGERTAIVILTDGDDNRSFLPFEALVGSIQESGALIYPLYVPSGLIAAAAANLNADMDPLRAKYMSLPAKSEGEGERLAKVSGGVYYPITQIGQIQRAYEDIVVQLRTAYNITFRSNTSTTGVSPRLKIKSKRENTFVTVNSVAKQ